MGIYADTYAFYGFLTDLNKLRLIQSKLNNDMTKKINNNSYIIYIPNTFIKL